MCFIVTVQDTSICKRTDYDISDITPYTHEEVDIRIFLHLVHNVFDSHTSVYIRTIDTDVLVLAVFALAQLNDVRDDIVIGFGMSSRKTKNKNKSIK